jgi:hypothetical protein
MIKMIGGAAKLMAAIAVPHCNKATNTCELRARASGENAVALGRQWATGACYPSREAWLGNSNYNWAVFPCADGLECRGYQAHLFSYDTYGTCTVVNAATYAKYTKYTPTQQDIAQQNQKIVADYDNTEAAAASQRTCSNFKTQLARYLDAEGIQRVTPGRNIGELGGVLNAQKPLDHCRRYASSVGVSVTTDAQFWSSKALIDKCTSVASDILDVTRFVVATPDITTCGKSDATMADYIQRGQQAWNRLDKLLGILATKDRQATLD